MRLDYHKLPFFPALGMVWFTKRREAKHSFVNLYFQIYNKLLGSHPAEGNHDGWHGVNGQAVMCECDLKFKVGQQK